MATTHQLVLASASPRRKALLESMGLRFSIEIADIDETHFDGEAPRDYVSRLALSKAETVHQKMLGSDKNESCEYAILSADTIVTQNNDVFGKPKDEAQVYHIWRQLSNARHQVMTAVTLHTSNHVETRVCVTDVEFGHISESQMHRYWQSGEPLDKAGGYAIQGLASAWVNLIHGSYSNVVGLPLKEVNELLRVVNLNWL